MTKKQVRKEAHRRIVDGTETHQEVFDSLKTGKPGRDQIIVEELVKVPSNITVQNNKVLITATYVVLGLLVLSRVLSLYGMYLIGAKNITMTIALLIMVLAPGMMVYGIIRRKIELIRGAAIVLIIGALRSLRIEISLDPIVLIFYAPWLGTVILGFVLSSKLKTPVTKKLSRVTNPEGKLVHSVSYQFDEVAPEYAKDEVLDDDF